MPCPTGSFKIISRGKGQSCMASCAYYSGEKKYSDTAFPLSKDLRDSISSVVIKAYRQKIRENAAENTATNTAPDYGNAPTPTDADAPPENSDYDMPEPF